MSFKSQKSWNEEIAEIWEKSYSVKSRTASEESLSCEEESQSEALCRILLSAMNPAVLSKLRRHFSKRHIRSLRDVARRVEEIMRAAAAEEGIEFQQPETASALEPPRAGALWIDQRGFIDAINTIFGNHKYEVHAQHLFQALDPLCTRQATWSALLTRLAAAGERRTRLAEGPRINEEDIAVVPLQHANRETIVKIVNIVTESSYCMVAVSRGGRVGVYHERRLLYQYQLWYHRSGVTKRVKNCWVTDAIYMRDVQYLVISASDRSLTFYDASILTHAPIFCITGIPNIPTCLDYDASQHKTEASELAFGDERGKIVRMIFLQPRVALMYKNYADRINSYFWGELSSPPHDSYLSIISWSRVHTRSVRRLQYLRSKDAIMSCSHDGTNTVVLRHRRGKIKDYVFNVPRGVHSFTAIHDLQLLATGSADGSRLWELTQSEPFASFKSTHAVQDIAVVAHLEIIVVFYKNCSLEIWDLYEECLLQTIKIKFPFLGVLGRKAEFGSYCIYPGPPSIKVKEEAPSPESTSRRSSVHRAETGGLVLRNTQQDTLQEEDPPHHPSHQLLVTCCEYVALLPLCASHGDVPAAPRDARAPALPAEWPRAHADLLMSSVLTDSPGSPPKSPVFNKPGASEGLLSVEAARRPVAVSEEDCSADLEDMLEKAGLQGILEKDFVLLTGLKRDLNQKIAELKTNMKQMSLPVRLGAPALALRLHELAPPAPPPPDLVHRYTQIMSLFPASDDNSTTPRRRSKTSSNKT